MPKQQPHKTNRQEEEYTPNKDKKVMPVHKHSDPVEEGETESSDIQDEGVATEPRRTSVE